MLAHPTQERLIALGLTGMAKALDDQRRSPDITTLGFEERLGLLVDHEAAERENRRMTTRLKFAALRQEGVQFHCYGWPAPASDKVQLITNSFILPNMIAKAVTGTSTKEAIAWGANEMKKILAAG